MNLEISAVVLCVLAFFYGYGAFALLTGRALNQWTGKIDRGPAVRVGGIGVIALGVLFTWQATHPGQMNGVLVMMMVIILVTAWAQHQIKRREDRRRDRYRIPLVRPPRRQRKRKRRKLNQ